MASTIFASNLEFYQNSYAVIIGINNYNSDNVKNLGYAVEDAQSIANLLMNDLGFNENNIHLILDENATQNNIKNKLYEVALEAEENDRIVVFYGGHGETINLPSGGEVGYLLPFDGNPKNLYSSGISMQELKQISEITQAKHVLYLIDVCYGGIMTVGTRSLVRNDFNDDERYLKKITNQPARQIITAGGKGEKAQERAIWGHSAFTKELLSGIKDGLADSDTDGYITADELGIFLSKKVFITSEENQTPINGRYGSGEGEFIFINPAHIENIIEAKVENKISSKKNQTNTDNSNTLRALSNLTNLLQNTVSNSNTSNNSDNDLLLNEEYTDSLWLRTATKTIETSVETDIKIIDIFFRKLYRPYLDYKGLRFSTMPYPIAFRSINRVSGITLGNRFNIANLNPFSFSLSYKPQYSLSNKNLYHDLNIDRYLWGNKKRILSFRYYDLIETNDAWMREEEFNNISTFFYGKDYMDHFHAKGYTIGYKKTINNSITIMSAIINDNQKYLPSIMNYTNSIFRKRNLINRENFGTAPHPFQDGQHLEITTGFTYNKLDKKVNHEFTFILEFEDTSFTNLEHKFPTVYLIPESKGWRIPKGENIIMKMRGQDKIIPAILEEFSFVNDDDQDDTLNHIRTALKELPDSLFSSTETKVINRTESGREIFNVEIDSLIKVRYHYKVKLNLPTGTHAYRFLIDSTRYELDENSKIKTINRDGKAIAVSTINISTPFRFDLKYDYANKRLGGDFSYDKLIVNFSTIQTLSNNDAFLFRLIGGWSKGELPVQKLFYIGGEGTVRGFSYMDTKKYSGSNMLLIKNEYYIHAFDNAISLFYDLALIGEKLENSSPITSYGISFGSDLIDYSSDVDPLEFSLIIYKTKYSNNNSWGMELMFDYFLNQSEIFY